MNIKKSVLFVILLIASLFKTSIAQQYNYKVDLKNVIDDKVKVTCIVPKTTAENVEFIFPNVVPGSYALKEYGRYIENFTAYDESGKKLKIKKADKYNFLISGASRLQRVEYFVNDSWEEKKAKRFIFQPGGTNIEAGKNFVINNYGFFGYIDGKKNIPFEVNFLKPENLKGYSYLKINSQDVTTDELRAPNYDVLADNPIMYCPPQDASFKIGESEINICLYSEKNKVSSQQLLEIIQPVAKALEKFFNKLPVDRYLFMFYLADPQSVSRLKGGGLGSGFGALEHNHCSFYFMPETSNFTSTKQMLTEVCAHEFLHILTPLNIHSKEIEDFNFRVPVMSKHLWMYEGVTEYFSHLILLQDSITQMKDFIKEVRSKINQSGEYDSFSMLEMSKNVIEKENQNRYRSVYSRGAILAMMLDILIIDKSNGKNSLKQVMMQLAQKYGPSKPFDDDQLLSEIVALTYPEVESFFKECIIGKKTPDYKKYLNMIGYDFHSRYEEAVYYFGRFGLSYFENTKSFVFQNVEMNLFGIENGDVLVAIENQSVTTENFNDLFEMYFLNNHNARKTSLNIMRNGKTLTLSAFPQKALKTSSNYIAPINNPDSKMNNNLKKFIGVLN